MNKNNIKKIGIVSSIVVAVVYLIFLVLPLFLSPILNAHSTQIAGMISQPLGFKVKLDKVQLITTPKLTIGLKIGKVGAFLPNNDRILETKNIKVKLSLLPILFRKIEIDTVSADNISVYLRVQKDGKFLIEKYIPKPKGSPKKEGKSASFFKLSNHLPDIKIKKYKILFMASNKQYSIDGTDVRITDFIINKKIKLSGRGKIVLDGKEQFFYDIKVLNEIMPNIQLNDLLFNPKISEKTETSNVRVDIIQLFKALYNNQLMGNLKCDIKTSGSLEGIKIRGFIKFDKLSMVVDNKKLPDSDIALDFKSNKVKVNSNIYPTKNGIIKIAGELKTGKHPRLDMNFKANTNLKSILKIANSVTKSFGINDLQAISADGVIDADFNIKSDLKKIKSSGYFNVSNANLAYKLYDIGINNIHSRIVFNNNVINIKDTGFSILGQPLKVYGIIKHDATADLHLIADKLLIKSLLLSLGQVNLLKENRFKSGTLTLNASLSGKLNHPNSSVNVKISNLNIRNVSTASSIILTNANAKLNLDKKSFKGKIVADNFKLINSAATIFIPKTIVGIAEKEIIINPTKVFVDKIKLNISGKVQNYLSEKIVLDIKTVGDINSYLKGDIYTTKQKLNLNYTIPSFCIISIPEFIDSKLQVRGNVAIAGVIDNPTLKGAFSIPYILLPDIDVSMYDMSVNLNGPILNGTGRLKKLLSGEVVAQNLDAKFLLKGDMFYLSDIKGDAYSGKVNGNITYNIINGKTGVNFRGSKMNASSAIYAVAGMKNALSGVLGFNTKVNFQGTEYEDMIKSLKGNLYFNIDDGMFGRIGRLEAFLNAKNILANVVIRNALSMIPPIKTIQDIAKFKYIKGSMMFNDGWANISSIKTSGPNMSYYINGKYNLLSGTTNVIILGRLGSNVVSLLGPIGSLSVDKLTSYIPKFGTLTSAIIKSMTTNPAKENIASIPSLSSGNNSYKDFKVVFNGGAESKSSVKSFKWLSNVDTSAFDLKNTVSDVKKQLTDVKNSTVNEVKNTVNETKQQLKDTQEELMNLFKF